MYRIISPSRASAVPLFQKSIGVGGGRGREPEKIFPNKTGRRVQQKFNSPKISSSPTNHPPQHHLSAPKNPSPRSPKPTVSRPRAFSGQTRANLGQNRAILGRFWVDSRLSRAKITLFWAPFPPSLEPTSAPGDVQKLHLSSSAHNRAPSTLISRSRTNYRVFITFTSKNTPLSL